MVVWLVLAVPFHSAPGVEEFHTTPEFHVNGSGMGPDHAGNPVGLAMVIFGGRSLTEGKFATAA
jgi:hypothetical protein